MKNFDETIYKKVILNFLPKIVPTNLEKERAMSVFERVKSILDKAFKDAGLKAEIRLEGSMSHDTWLRVDMDIDIFIVLPLGDRSDLERVVAVCQEVFKDDWKERYSEHPFGEIIFEGYRIEIVPCFKIEMIEDRLSAVDRTPLHTEFLLSQLNDDLRIEIRLLKAFMKGIGVYGAELRVGGFSGYLTELLCLYYGSFINVCKNAINWKSGKTVLQLINFYEDLRVPLDLFNNEPLIFVDPVDRGRNVGSALTLEKLNVFRAAAKTFLKLPSENFFYPLTPPLSLSDGKLLSLMNQRKTFFFALVFKELNVAPDILWGQIFRSERAIVEAIEESGFQIIGSLPWSDEAGLVFLLFEVTHREIPAVLKHKGPPVSMEEEINFLKKHLDSSKVLAGPYIREKRWFVELEREFTDVISFIQHLLTEKINSLGLGSYFRQALKKGFTILENEEIVKYLTEKDELRNSLSIFLVKKPSWLKYCKN
ncbi:MAG: CCA tRNA nucleotidyltransferase [Candidatus Hodarchaeota archaeon]